MPSSRKGEGPKFGPGPRDRGVPPCPAESPGVPPSSTEPEDPGLDGTGGEDPDSPVLDSRCCSRARAGPVRRAAGPAGCAAAGLEDGAIAAQKRGGPASSRGRTRRWRTTGRRCASWCWCGTGGLGNSLRRPGAAAGGHRGATRRGALRLGALPEAGEAVAWDYLKRYARRLPGTTVSRSGAVGEAAQQGPRCGSTATTTRTRSAAPTSTASSTSWRTSARRCGGEIIRPARWRTGRGGASSSAPRRASTSSPSSTEGGVGEGPGLEGAAAPGAGTPRCWTPGRLRPPGGRCPRRSSPRNSRWTSGPPPPAPSSSWSWWCGPRSGW